MKSLSLDKLAILLSGVCMVHCLLGIPSIDALVGTPQQLGCLIYRLSPTSQWRYFNDWSIGYFSVGIGGYLGAS